MGIRDATTADAQACAEIYAPYVLGTAVTFELDPPSGADFAARISAAQSTYAWLVLEHAERVVGYAYGGPYKDRAAYRWSCEVSVYLERDHCRRGGGRELYESLFERLAARGFRTAVAGMTLPNASSVGLHTALGFQPIGIFRGIGWKHGAWHDVAWMQRSISSGEDPPTEPC